MNKNLRLILPSKIQSQNLHLSVQVLIDSGSEQNLISPDFVRSHKLPVKQLSIPIKVSALDGSSLTAITHCTTPLTLTVSGNHSELISFFVFPISDAPVVLGFAWLQQHSPTINWSESRIEAWSSFCHLHCLGSAIPTSSPHPPAASELPDLAKVAPEYHDLHQAFNKTRALSLPPHRPYDCAIDLLPGAPLPTARLFNLSRKEREAMEDYIIKSLDAGIIRPSSSPLGAGFFFVEKKRQVP